MPFKRIFSSSGFGVACNATLVCTHSPSTNLTRLDVKSIIPSEELWRMMSSNSPSRRSKIYFCTTGVLIKISSAGKRAIFSCSVGSNFW